MRLTDKAPGRIILLKVLAVIFMTLPGWYLIAVLYRFDPRRQWLSIIPSWNSVLAVFALSIIVLALMWGQTRSQVINVLKQDYVRTARSKGLPGQQVLTRHVMRNSLTPSLGIFGGLLPFLLTSQLLIERMTSWQGLGNFFFQAAYQRDYTELMGVFTLLVVICVASSFLADLIQVYLEPKLREQQQGGMRGSLYLKKIDGDPSYTSRGWGRRSVVRPGALLFLIIAAFFLVRLSAPEASPGSSESSAQPNALAAATFKQIDLPGEMKVVLTDTITKGERNEFIEGISTREGNRSIESAQDSTKSSKRTIIATSSQTIEVLRKFENYFEEQGWKISQKYISGSKFNYIYIKEDKYTWLCGDIFQPDFKPGVYNYLINKDEELLKSISDTNKVNSNDLIVAITQGFKLPDKDSIVRVIQ